MRTMQRRKGGRPRRSRLEGDDLVIARKLYSSGALLREVASQFGVSASTVRRSFDDVGGEPSPRAKKPQGAHNPPLLNPTRRSAPDAVYDPARDGEQGPSTLTAALLGDPPPGRRELLEASARRTAPPEVHPNYKHWRM